MRKLLTNSNLKADAERRLEELMSARTKLEKRLKNAPVGKIHIVNSGNRIQFYLREKSSERSGTYLNKTKQRIIKTHLQKSYDEKMLRLIDKEIEVLKRFLISYQNTPLLIRNEFSHLPQKIKDNILPLDMSDDEYAKLWQDLSFESKEIEKEKYPFISDRGEHVRSKSELNIANTLNKHHIPYKYECPLELRRGKLIHPDFTVLNKRTRQIRYWEHRGMMDLRDYAKDSVQRIKDYNAAGLLLGTDLIITEETATIPLGTREITDIIQAYFM